MSNKRHDMLTAVGQVLSMYGVNAQYRLAHNDSVWLVMFFDDIGCVWNTEYHGPFHDCLNFIREYNRPADKPF